MAAAAAVAVEESGEPRSIVPVVGPPPPPAVEKASPFSPAPVPADEGSTVVRSVVRRWRREDLLEKGGLLLRALAWTFSLVSVAVLASNKRGGWMDFDRYQEYRYLLSVAVIALVYSTAQLFRQAHRISTGKDLAPRWNSGIIDFAGDQSRLTGNIMHSVQSGYSASHERTLMKGRDEISLIVDSLRIGGGDSIINKAHAFYQIAVDKNFTKGRRTPQVAAACLYIACRQTKKAYLLIDFSDFLKINVYVLGAVFLQLCKTLSLSEHPIVQKLVDPCLFIHRFTERLLGRKNNAVSETALRIVASMKRDWMQTGRKPSGLCGAALYIAALSHGLSYSKSDVVSVVHVCETTLTKRLIEFENTESGSLTIEEFLARADELDAESESNQLPKPGEVLCKHKDGTTPHFAHGLCKKCYDKFVKISGGLQGGAEPPAFQRAEMQRKEKARQQEKTSEFSPVDDQHVDDGLGSVHRKKKSCANMTPDIGQSEGKTLNGPESAGNQSVDPSACSDQEDLGDTSDNESDNFSDIDDAEVDGYLHDEKEKELKRIIWEEMNKEYLEEQAAKEAAAAAAKAAYEANFADGSEDVLAAKELAEATAAALAKLRKEKKQKRAEEAKNAPPPQTPLEATRQMLKRKAFSSKVNYEALEALYTSEENGKKQKAESETIDPSELPSISENDAAGPGDEGDMEDADELGTFDDNNFGEVSYDDYMGHGDDGYGYDDDFGFS